MLKHDWVIVLALCFYVSFLAFAAGAFTYSLSGATFTMPHGPIEYWLNRYQTLAVSVFAFFGLIGVWLQIGSMKKQTRAGLLQAHKSDFTALAMASSSAKRLKSHADFAQIFKLRHGAFSSVSPPPALDPELLKSLQRALSTTVPDPLGIVDLHDSWALACDQLATGVMPLSDFDLVASQTISDCDALVRAIGRIIETLHAQIESSV